MQRVLHEAAVIACSVRVGLSAWPRIDRRSWATTGRSPSRSSAR